MMCRALYYLPRSYILDGGSLIAFACARSAGGAQEIILSIASPLGLLRSVVIPGNSRYHEVKRRNLQGGIIRSQSP